MNTTPLAAVLAARDLPDFERRAIGFIAALAQPGIDTDGATGLFFFGDDLVGHLASAFGVARSTIETIKLRFERGDLVSPILVEGPTTARRFHGPLEPAWRVSVR